MKLTRPAADKNISAWVTNLLNNDVSSNDVSNNDVSETNIRLTLEGIMTLRQE